MYKKILIILSMLLFLCSCAKQPGAIISESEAVTGPAPTEKTESLIAVYVCGQVLSPGLYYIPSDARVQDAIDAAGGLGAEASLSTVNPAAYVQDGDKIYIPSEAEVLSASLNDAEQSDGRVNINTATKEELMTLPGIGESKADSIISYRDEHGGYTSVEEIKNISGIKDGVFQKIKDMIKV